MVDKDIRWVQRFNNYQKALQQLKEAVDLMKARDLSNLEKQGMIQAFEFTHQKLFRIKVPGTQLTYKSRAGKWREVYH